MSISIHSNPSLPHQPSRIDAPETSAAGAARGAHTHHGVTTAAEVAAASAANVADIGHYLNDHVFRHHGKAHAAPAPANATAEQKKAIADHNAGVDVHNDQLQALIQARAVQLDAMQETPQSIADTVAKAQKMDRLATTASSTFRAIPFAAASVLQYMKPELNKGDWLPAPLKPFSPLISGAVSGVMDQVGTGVMNRVTGDAHFLKAPADKLHGVMAQSMKDHQPGLMQQTLDMGVGIQTYSLRNVGRTVVAPALASHPKIQAGVDLGIATLGGLAANAGFGNRMHSTEQRDHQRGAAYVFGRKDTTAKPLAEETEWREAYLAIKHASYSGAVMNAGKRVAGMPVDIATDGLKSVRGLVSATGLMQNGLALAGGFALAGTLQEKAVKHYTHPAAKAAVSQATNLGVSSLVFPAWTTAGVLTDPAVKKAEDLLQHGLKPAADKAAGFVAKGSLALGKQGIALGADLGRSTATALNQRYENLRARPARVADEEEGGIAADPNAMDLRNRRT
jgi:hypothetical protein